MDLIVDQVIVSELVHDLYQDAVFRGDERILSPTFPELNLSAAQVLAARLPES